MMKKILVIEDEVRTRRLFLRCLEGEGFCAIGAENGRVGIEQAQKHLPDLVVCDIVMPEQDGYSVLSTLREDPSTAVIPFIFLTARVFKADIRKGMNLGADDYLTKPCTVEELLEAIAARLEKQAVLQQWYVFRSQLVTKSPSTDTTPLSDASQLLFPSNPQLQKVFNFIEANYHQSITLSDVAQAVGYSPAYLTSVLRQQTGRTLYRWIVERKMAAARFLLLETDQTVNHISINLGYKNIANFSRQFRQFHGTSPQVWRNARCVNSSLLRKN